MRLASSTPSADPEMEANQTGCCLMGKMPASYNTNANIVSAKSAKKTTFIYVVSEGQHGPIKVGRANNAKDRKHGLQSGNPRALRLAGYWRLYRDDAVSVEYMLKKRLNKYYIPQSEWYSCDEKFMLEFLPQFFTECGFVVFKYSEKTILTHPTDSVFSFSRRQT
jgi:hypothetical protein